VDSDADGAGGGDPEKIYESAGPPPALVSGCLLDDRVIAQYTGILPPPQTPVEEIPASLTARPRFISRRDTAA